MKNKLYSGSNFNFSLDWDSSVFWKDSVSKLGAKLDFCYSSVSHKGYLNLDKHMEKVSSLDVSVVEDDSLVSNFLDSSDWDVTQGLSVFKGEGSHVSNELESLDVFLEDDVLVDDFCDPDSFSYGGFSYNDLFFESLKEDEEALDLDTDDGDLELEDDDDDEDSFEEELDEDDDGFDQEEFSYMLSFSGVMVFKDVNFIFLESTFNNLSDSELKFLMKKELKG